MKLLVIIICIYVAVSSQSLASDDKYNLAYDDNFIWYVAFRLSAQALNSVDTKTLSPSNLAQYRNDFALIYHHQLISCSGPLQEVADELFFIEKIVKDDKSNTRILTILGQYEYDYWPLITGWDETVRLKVLKMFTSRNYSSHLPNCIVAGYKKP